MMKTTDYLNQQDTPNNSKRRIRSRLRFIRFDRHRPFYHTNSFLVFPCRLNENESILFLSCSLLVFFLLSYFHWLISYSIYLNNQYEQESDDDEHQCVTRRKAVCSQKDRTRKNEYNQTTSSFIAKEKRKGEARIGEK